MTFVYLSLFAVGSLAAEAGYLCFRYWNQMKQNAVFATYETTFPGDVTNATPALLILALGGLNQPVGRRHNPWGVQSLVWEVLGLPDGIHHLISVPIELEEVLIAHLRGVIPNIGIRRVASQRRTWTCAVELHRPEEYTKEADPSLSAVLLSSLAGLEAGTPEAVLIQLVFAPTGRTTTDESAPPFWVAGRLATAGELDRAEYLLKRVLVAYRSLQVFAFKPIPKWRLDQIADRMAPVVRWPSSLSAATLAVVCGIPIDGPQVPGLVLSRGRRLAPEPLVPRVGSVIGMSNFLGGERPVALSHADRLRHLYLLGPTGSSKSTLMQNLFAQDVAAGHGACVIDPKGELIDA